MTTQSPGNWSIRPRLFLSILVATAVAVILPGNFHWPTRLLCTWDAGMLGFLASSWTVMLRATPATMRYHAQREDEGRLVILSLITAAACVSLLAIGFMLHDSKGISVELLILHVALSIVTIVGSWLLVHTIFAMHYARAYYRDSPKSVPSSSEVEGLDFPSDAEPDYWDFLYFSFVIGMTSQVSDVEIRSRSLRRLALLHSILSFFFNTMILAMSINIIAGLI